MGSVATPNIATEQMRFAAEAMRNREFQKAAAHYRAVASGALRPEALAGMAAALMELGRFTEALSCVSTAIMLTRPQWQWHVIRGRLLVVTGEYSRAVRDFRAAASIRDRARCVAKERCSIRRNVLLHTVQQLEYIEECCAVAVPWPRGLAGERRRELVRRLCQTAEQGTDDLFELAGADGHLLAAPQVNVRTRVRSPRNVLARNISAAAVQRTFLSSRPRVAVVDGLLSPEGLKYLWEVCLVSGAWHSSFNNGYVGAFPQDGFAPMIIFRLADELKTLLPDILGDCVLHHWWALARDDCANSGTGIHSDDADVTVNVWLTPDCANEHSGTGGLHIWDQAAPDDWVRYEDYNGGGPNILAYLEARQARSTTVSYRQNRAAIFDRRLFHQTRAGRFIPGFVNRRRNVTLAFRRFQNGAPQPARHRASDEGKVTLES